jgi:hypothetical protein
VNIFEKHGFIWGESGTITTRCISCTDQRLSEPRSNSSGWVGSSRSSTA